MSQLSIRARSYLLACYCLGLIALGWLLLDPFGFRQQSTRDWLLGAGLSLVAAACQVFVVARIGTNRSDHVTPAPLFAALVLLPRPILALMLIATFIPEWIVYRRRWYIQLWNIAAYLIAAVACRLVLMAITGHDQLEETLVPPTSVILLIPLFIGIQTVLLAIVLLVARRMAIRDSGLLNPAHFILEMALASLGLAFATAWMLNPLYGLATAFPLVLIFQALHISNLKTAALTDPKTGLANMRHFNTVITRDLERSERSGQPLSLLMCDLDYLRTINNSYGHQIGDRVLFAIAEVIRGQIRAGDLAARFGGEEFVVLLADTDVQGAAQMAERLRSDFEKLEFPVAQQTPLRATVSIGVASFPLHGRTAERLVREADIAVYQAKGEGRNRVVVAGRATQELAQAWAKAHVAPLVPTDTRRTSPILSFVRRLTTFSASGGGSQSAAATFAVDHPATVQEVQVDAGLLTFVAAVVLAGVLSILPGLALAPTNIWPLLILTLLTIISQTAAGDVGQRGRMSIAATSVLCGAFLAGGIGIVCTSLAMAITSAVVERTPVHRSLFNFGATLLAASAARLSFNVLTGGIHPDTVLSHVVIQAGFAGLIYYMISYLLLCMIRSFAEERSPYSIWLSDYFWLLLPYFIMGALGAVSALMFLQFGAVGVIALITPLALMQFGLRRYMARTSDYVDELRRLNGRLADSYEATLFALRRALDTRDEETEQHSQRVRQYTELIAQYVHVPGEDLEDMLRGALLHDLGKIGVPDAILLKPGNLDDQEQNLMRKHPEIGYSMISHIPFLERAGDVVLHHHEAFDGTGYPSGLSGNDVPLGARVFAVADAYDAMTTDRPYRKALGHDAAVAELQRCRGAQFDPQVVDAFLRIPETKLFSIQAGILSLTHQPELLLTPSLQPEHHSID